MTNLIEQPDCLTEDTIPDLLKLICLEQIQEDQKLKTVLLNIVSHQICLNKLSFSHYPLLFEADKPPTAEQMMIAIFLKIHLYLNNPVEFVACLNEDYCRSKLRIQTNFFSTSTNPVVDYARQVLKSVCENLKEEEQQVFRDEISEFILFTENSSSENDFPMLEIGCSQQ